ncbi:MAG TPA: lysophospholipid acyltransferase family protein [Steroidobacteraceae bacterium]|nr:lysophospholipid acyltransferase family protein [Steroidobacteraceae bacterium]
MTDSGPDGELRNTLYRTATRSSRRMTAGRRLLYRILVPVGHGIIRLWVATCRVKSITGAEHLTQALAKAPSLVPCYWHQHQMFCGKYLLDQRARGLTVGWLISPSVDGEIGAMLVKRFGAVAIRGSSSHTGARALRDYYLTLTRDKVSPIITPDGPRGPRFKFKPGAILLAQMSGRPMLPMAYAASRAWLVKWDKFVIPVPFSRIAIAIGPPWYVPRVTDAAGVERLQRQMEGELKRLFGEAKAALAGRASAPPG